MDIAWAAGEIGQIWAPLHELGHVVFGWLSFNPTIIAGWALCYQARDGFIGSIGGAVGGFLGVVAISELYLRVKPIRRLWPVALFMWLVDFTALPFVIQGDFPWLSDFTLPLTIARIAGLGCLIIMVLRRLEWLEFPKVSRRLGKSSRKGTPSSRRSSTPSPGPRSPATPRP